MEEHDKGETDNVIETWGLRKVYGRNKVAVDGLTLSVRSGVVFGFLGPNGAGKSTVVKMLVGLVFPTAGVARLLGRPLGDIAAKRRIGFLPEHFRFHEWLRADEFLDFHADLCGLSSEEKRRRIPEVLELAGLSSRADDKLRTFSKGMLQRIGIAQALLNDPDLVFLDEPTSALDPLGRREVRDLLGSLKAQGKSVFLNSHLLSEVELVCDQVAIIDRGRVVRQGNLAELLAQPDEVEVRVDRASDELLERIRERYPVHCEDGSVLRVSVSSEDDVPVLAEMVVKAGARLYGLNMRRVSLEDLFVSTVDGAHRE